MKRTNTLIFTVLTVLLITTSVSAADTKLDNISLLKTKAIATQNKVGKMPDDFKNLTLQEKKDLIIKKHTERINNAVKEGKINEQEANKEKEKLNTEVKSWDGKTPLKYLSGKCKNKVKLPENFEKMPLQEKRNWMINDFTEKMNAKVKSGEISKDEANNKIENMKIKISNWDGNFQKKDRR